MKARISILLLAVGLMLFACVQNEELPYLGEKKVDPKTGEYINYKAPSFSFVNQNNDTVRSADYSGKVKVVDFFFTSCPTICPKMTINLKKVQDHFAKYGDLQIISFSIDEINDTPQKLRKYALNYQIDNSSWDLLTGKSDFIFELAKDYKVMAFNDGSLGDINLIHDGTFVLIDSENNIRGYYNGLEEEDIDRLIHDIETLLNR